jgi:hypothetical protein
MIMRNNPLSESLIKFIVHGLIKLSLLSHFCLKKIKYSIPIISTKQKIVNFSKTFYQKYNEKKYSIGFTLSYF